MILIISYFHVLISLLKVSELSNRNFTKIQPESSRKPITPVYLYTTENFTTVNFTTVNFTTVNFTTVNFTMVNFTAVNFTTVNFTTVNCRRRIVGGELSTENCRRSHFKGGNFSGGKTSRVRLTGMAAGSATGEKLPIFVIGLKT